MPARIKNEELRTMMRLHASKDMGLFSWYLSKLLRDHGCEPSEYGINIDGWIVKLTK